MAKSTGPRWRKQSWIVEEWTKQVEEKDGPRTLPQPADPRVKITLDTSPLPEDDPLASWRAARQRKAEEAAERARTSPWSPYRAKEPRESTTNSVVTGWFDDSNWEVNDTPARGELSFLEDERGSMNRSSVRRVLKLRHRDYWRPWVAEPPKPVDTSPTRTEQGRRQHTPPRDEGEVVGARGQTWSRRYMMEHTLLWGGGGHWQKSVDEWEAKEAARLEVLQARAREAISSRSATRSTLHASQSSDTADGLQAEASFVSSASGGSDVFSEGDVSLPTVSRSVESTVSELPSIGSSGVCRAPIQRKYRWDVKTWAQKLVSKHAEPAGVPPSTKLTYVMKHKPAVSAMTVPNSLVPSAASSAVGLIHSPEVLSMFDPMTAPASLYASHDDVTAGSSMLTTSKVLPYDDSLLPGSAEPVTPAPSSRCEGLPNARQRTQPDSKFTPNKMAWQLTSSFMRKFEETSPPYVNFERTVKPKAVPSDMASTGVLGEADARPRFPWIEATIPRAENDPWARDSYAVGAAVNPARRVEPTHPMPWTPASPTRVTPNLANDVPVYESDKHLTVRTRTAAALTAFRIQAENPSLFASPLSGGGRKSSSLSPLKSGRISNRVMPLDGTTPGK
jgi:hypothetical protein